MQCILKIIIFFIVSEYLRRSPIYRKSNGSVNENAGFVGISVSLWYVYKPLAGKLLPLEFLLLTWKCTCSAALDTPLQGGEAPEFSCLSSASVGSDADQTESAEEVAEV